MKNRIYWLAILMIAVSITLSGCGGKEQRLAKHLEKGKAFYQEADYDKAKLEFKNVLQIDPKNAEAYYLTGVIEESQRNWQKAFGYYLKTVELNPNHLEAKAKLGKFYLISGDPANAEKTVNEILAKKPGDAAGRTVKAAMMASKKDEAGAIQELRQVIATDASQLDAIALLAALYAKQGNDAAALDVMDKGIPLLQMLG